MRLILVAFFIILPYISFAQGQERKFKIKIGTQEYALEEIPEELDLPQRLNRVWIKVDQEGDQDSKIKDKKDKGKTNPHEPDIITFTMLVGEEERSFPIDGQYYECKFTHDIKELVCYILDENRLRIGRPFILKKRE